MYNVFSLIAQETSRLPIQERQSYFYNLFLGKNSNDYMSWYEEAVKQYQKVIKEYNAIYKIDFGIILENWMKQDYKYFDDVFLAKNLKTNIDKHYFIPPIQTPEEKRRAVEKSWRQNGVVMNIPFFYNSSLPGSNKWKIDKANFRIFPFSYELKPMYYYYSYSKAIVKYNQPPTILLNYEGTGDSARASQIRPLIYNALINSINPPQALRFPTSCYALLEESTIKKTFIKNQLVIHQHIAPLKCIIIVGILGYYFLLNSFAPLKYKVQLFLE